MANYQFSADLIAGALFRVGERTDGQSQFAASAVTYLNRAYQAVWLGGGELVPGMHEEWWWLKKSPPGTLILQPAITTGTVQVQHGVDTITFSAAPSADLDGWFFTVDGQPDVFRISSHTAAAVTATLDSVYTGPDAATAAYRVFKLEYPLATDILKIVGPMRQAREGDYRIEGIDLSELDRMAPLHLTQAGTPQVYAHVTETTVRFDRYPGTGASDHLRVEYDYQFRPADLTNSPTEEPVVPRQHRRVLEDYIAGWLFIDKNDNRADGALLAAKNGLLMLAAENRHKQAEQAKGRAGHIAPRQGDTGLRSGPLRTSGGLIIG